jgi:hypothetical protein
VKLPRLTQHGSEIVLLGLIAGGVIWLLGKAIDKSGEGAAAYDLAAFLLVLQAIITAIKDRWTQRSVDHMGQQLANSNPVTEPVPDNVTEAAQQTAEAAQDKADKIAATGKPDDMEARP